MANDRVEVMSPFGRAAVALDEELERYKRLAGSVERAELDSRKGIERAARMLREASESREQLAVRMQDLVRTLQVAREENERWTEVLEARRDAIEKRGTEVQALIDRFRGLADRARAVAEESSRLATVPGEGEAAAGGEVTPMVTPMVTLESIERGLDELIEESRSLARDANDAGIDELGAEANTLKQQLSAARNRMDLVRQRLGQAAEA